MQALRVGSRPNATCIGHINFVVIGQLPRGIFHQQAWSLDTPRLLDVQP